MRVAIPRSVIVSAVAISMMGCGLILKPDPDRVAQQGKSAVAPPPQLSDANIAAIFLAANNTDISYARLVATRSKSADVRRFADRMMSDHSALLAQVTEIIGVQSLEPQEHEISLDLRDESASKRDIMRELEGHSFDSAYAINEVSYHRRLLGALDGLLIPQVRDTSMKRFLSAVRPAVAAHLAHAEQLQGTILPARKK
ncbi:MAG: hypothetical protein JWO05_8 [Gemmatimonadetes bacterium]|nr:hypothetical protein [Gemmatimonadota bacterium]